MKINNILLVSIIFSGCTMKMGPKTYDIFKKNRDFDIGFSVENKKYIIKYNYKKIYDQNNYIYIVKYSKKCIFGYITNKNDKKQIILNWTIISEKKYCKTKKIAIQRMP